METQTEQRERGPGGRLGYNKEDYVEAVENGGSIRKASLILGVDRKTVREQMARHEIVNPWTGEVPNVKGI